MPAYDAAQLRDRYDGASTLMGMAMLLSVFLAVFVVGSTFAFTVAQRRRARQAGRGTAPPRLLR